jgi:hypothetical protein
LSSRHRSASAGEQIISGAMFVELREDAEELILS